MRRAISATAFVLALAASSAHAQVSGPGNRTPAAKPAAKPATTAPPAATGVRPPADYVIGVDDALDVVFWREKEMSATVTVRPDGKISLPLINDVTAAGLTPDALRASITTLAGKFVEDATVTVVVKAINSRKVFITGQVGKPGPYPMMDTITVLQLISMAGGLNEYAKAEDIRIVRIENGKPAAIRFNYNEVAEGKSLAQNIALKPGDSVIVP